MLKFQPVGVGIQTIMSYDKSKKIMEEARKYIPGGYSSVTRAFEPRLVWSRAKGSRIWDADGNEYIDYHAAYGPPILGHNNEKVNRSVKETMERIDLVGGTTEMEVEAAEKITHHLPSVEQVGFCNSGTEATYHALRLARASTGRSKIIKFQGCYHGWHDSVVMNVATPKEKMGKYDPLTAGLIPHAMENTIVLPFNNLEQVETAVAANKGDVAAVILEPIMHNVGCVIGKNDFLRGLREIADREGIVLIFDEIITGFRHGLGGYQGISGVHPDLTTFGKAMANGYPIGALGGRADLMKKFAPGGGLFFSGTFNAHPFSISACLATMRELESGWVYPHLFKLGKIMTEGMSDICNELGIRAVTSSFGSVFTTYFMEPPVNDYGDLLRNDQDLFVQYRKRLIEKGIFMTPYNLRRSHISAAHSERDIRDTLDKSREVLTGLQKSNLASSLQS